MIKRWENIDIKERNSFHVSAKVAHLIEFTDKEDLCEISEGLRPKEWMAVGSINNIIFTRDVNLTLLCPRNERIVVLDETSQYVDVYAGAGRNWDELVEWSVQHELWGLENLSLIPGSVGASPVQNIGAYGAEAKDTILSVEMFDMESRKFVTLAAEHCAFAYRESVFKHFLRGRVVITGVNFRLGKTPLPKLNYGDLQAQTMALGACTLENIRKAVCEIRRRKLPDPAVQGNVGSFFKNPVVDDSVAQSLLEKWSDMPHYASLEVGRTKLAAGWLIDKCGLKGFSNGLVGVHERQALVLVNMGGATGRDVMDFAAMVQQRVYEKFGVRIETEVNVI